MYVCVCVLYTYTQRVYRAVYSRKNNPADCASDGQPLYLIYVNADGNDVYIKCNDKSRIIELLIEYAAKSMLLSRVDLCSFADGTRLFQMDMDLPKDKPCCRGLCDVCYRYIAAASTYVRAAVATVAKCHIDQIGFNFSAGKGFHIATDVFGMLSGDAAGMILSSVLKLCEQGAHPFACQVDITSRLQEMYFPYIREVVLPRGTNEETWCLLRKMCPGNFNLDCTAMRIRGLCDRSVTTSSSHNLAMPGVKHRSVKIGDEHKECILFGTPMTIDATLSSTVKDHVYSKDKMDSFCESIHVWCGVVRGFNLST